MSDELFGSVGKIQTKKLFHKSSRRGKKNSKFLKHQKGGSQGEDPRTKFLTAYENRFGADGNLKRGITLEINDVEKYLGKQEVYSFQTPASQRQIDKPQSDLRANVHGQLQFKLKQPGTAEIPNLNQEFLFDESSNTYKPVSVVHLDLLLDVNREIEDLENKLNNIAKTIDSEYYPAEKKDSLRQLEQIYRNMIKDLDTKIKQILKVSKLGFNPSNYLKATRRDFPDLELTPQFMENFLDGVPPPTESLRATFNGIIQTKDAAVRALGSPVVTRREGYEGGSTGEREREGAVARAVAALSQTQGGSTGEEGTQGKKRTTEEEWSTGDGGTTEEP